MAKKNDIAKVEPSSIQPVEQIESLIITVRGKQVILDRDLARLYGVETKRLNQQVQRNIERFPEDFMFQLTKEEAESSRSQFATLNGDDTNLKSQNAISNEEDLRSQFVTLEKEDMRGKHVKFLPYAFTENGIAMLSSVLRSPMAIATNIHIMRDAHNKTAGVEPIQTHKWRNASHDRWIIADDTLYHCGHSLKDTGNKLSCIDVITSISADVVLNYVR